jgi:tetratricopeptide (TPR) repeat protein
LGAPRLEARIVVAAYRRHPDDARLCRAHAQVLLERRGPLAAWSFLASLPPHEADAPQTPSLHGIRALALAKLRDFDAAHATLATADRATPEDRHADVVRSFVLLAEDRYDEALAIARRALDARPDARSAAQQAAQCLVLLDRGREALDVLERAAGSTESAQLFMQRASIETSLRLHDAALASVERALELSPLAEPAVLRRYRATLSSIAYRRGDVASSIAYAWASGEPRLLEVADRMERAPADARRVELDVPFVRQHHQTCVPATLTAISRYWGMPAEHMSVAEAICYDGTLAHSQRTWAEENGWLAGELTLTWDAARALIDAGIPFVALTSAAVEGHAQAIVGYDERRGSFHVRDPARPEVLEADAKAFLEALASTGPRALWLVPRAEAGRVETLSCSLPDAALWDRLYAVQRALARHDREVAEHEARGLVAEAPDHVVALSARRALAAYDSDVVEARSAAEAVLRHHPHDARAELEIYAAMREVAPRAERIAWLEACARPGADPIFLEQLGEELHADAREEIRARHLLRRAARARPGRGRSLMLLGMTAWKSGKLDAAMPLLRFAACLEDANDGLAQIYFNAARARGETAVALDLLRARVRRLGRRSSAPAITLHDALVAVDRAGEAAGVLEEALACRPDDEAALLHAAQFEAARGRDDDADDLLARGAVKCDATRWARTAANIARTRGDAARTLQLLRRAVEWEPLDIATRSQLVEVLTALEGRDAAVAHVEAAIERFPHNRPVLQLYANLQAESSPEAHERAARRALDAEPAAGWAHQHRVVALLAGRRIDEARAASDEACAVAPDDPSTWLVRARVLAAGGDAAGAAEAMREAVRLSVDHPAAVAALLGSSRPRDAQRRDLELVEEEIRAKSVNGAAVPALHDRLRAELSPDDALAVTTRLRLARPDLWAAWSADIRQLAATGPVDEATKLAQEATDRFPLVAALWIDRADLASVAGDADAEGPFLERAHAAAPLDPTASARLADALEHRGDIARARLVLERAAGASTHPRPALAIAALLDRAGDLEGAVRQVRRVLAMAPDLETPWIELARLHAKAGRADEAFAEARRVAEERPWSARMACTVAHIALERGDSAYALAQLARAIEIAPRWVEAHDEYAVTLARAGRLDDALAACRPAVFGDALPLELRGRAAWIDLRRGKAVEAAFAFRALVAEEPGYWWGWLTLLEASAAAHDTEGYAVAAERLVALAPDAAKAHSALGDARMEAGDREGAKASWARAAQRSGADVYPLLRLVRAAAEDGEVETAERWCARLRSLAGDLALASEARVAIAAGNRERAVDVLRRACASTIAAADMVVLVHRILVFAGLGDQALAVLDQAVATDRPVRAMPATLWALASIERNDARVERWLFDARSADDARASVAAAVIRRLGECGRGARLRWVQLRLPMTLRRSPIVQEALRKALAGSPKQPTARGVGLGPANAWAVAAVLVIFVIALTITQTQSAPSMFWAFAALFSFLARKTLARRS